MTNLFTEYLYFAVGFFFLNKKTEIIDVFGVILFLNKAIKVWVQFLEKNVQHPKKINIQ
jgi:hypothetical protein